jgi:hypothetical protein
VKSTSIVAAYSARSLVGDGGLTSPFWETCSAQSLQSPRDTGQRTPRESGTVRYAWCANYLYAGFCLVDSDPVTDATANQQRLWELGDVAEWFLQPPGSAHYWEFHATPGGHKACLLLPGAGRRGLPSNFCSAHLRHLRVSSLVNGSLNDQHRFSKGWTTLLAFPRDRLARQGTPVKPGATWRMLAARYNYSRELPAPELTSYPRLPRTDFHTPEHFATVTFAP